MTSQVQAELGKLGVETRGVLGNLVAMLKPGPPVMLITVWTSWLPWCGGSRRRVSFRVRHMRGRAERALAGT